MINVNIDGALTSSSANITEGITANTINATNGITSDTSISSQDASIENSLTLGGNFIYGDTIHHKYTPVYLGGGPYQQTNAVHIGWGKLPTEDSYRVLVSVDNGNSYPISTGLNVSYIYSTMKYSNTNITVSGGNTANLTVYLYKYGRVVYAVMDDYPVYFAASNVTYWNTNAMPTHYRPIEKARFMAPSWASGSPIGTVWVEVKTNGQIGIASSTTSVQEIGWSACWITATDGAG